MDSGLNREQRIRVFEEFEQRLVMSANPLTQLGLTDVLSADSLSSPAEQQAEFTTLGYIDAQPEITQIQQQTGFDGSGQTVAVIDSGIAWDHYALGGGFGEGNRVVGGWDFAEDDANPYDDGPAGYHGTHVAGVIGSDEATNSGVSPGVDLVALRVLDDNGLGEISWVEDALAWVHQNRNQFKYPITTVNLSLGADWNADAGDDWASLEDEFAQLEMDGIFISVAAGNGFESFNQSGLSFPASSQYVVPVGSYDSNGQISDFSQREDRLLLAPGEIVRSTVPGHLFGSDATDRFLSASGTSMAAPYVAGASAVLRQANEFMGAQDIDQDLLRQQFIDSADRVFDAQTAGYFYRINLQAAIDSVVADLDGDSWSRATDAGIVDTGTEFRGTIGTVDDKDVFAFVAAQTGSITLNVETTDELTAVLSFENNQASVEGNTVTLAVVAGQQYKFAVESTGQIGHYNIGVQLQSGFTATDWGTVASASRLESLNGEKWFRLTAANDGFMTIQARAEISGNVTAEIYDDQMNLIVGKTAAHGELRLDTYGRAGTSYYVRAEAVGESLRFEISNLVSLRNGKLEVLGTTDDNVVQVWGEQLLTIDTDGLRYQLPSSRVESIGIIASAGQDSLSIRLGDGNDRVVIQPTALRAESTRWTLIASGFETIDVDGGLGTDQLFLRDSSGNDYFETDTVTAQLSGPGYANLATGFEEITVTASAGLDSARLIGTSGIDRFGSSEGGAFLRSEQATVSTQGFERNYLAGRGGNDLVNLFDSAGNDQFQLREQTATLIADSYRVWVNHISKINAISTVGIDSVLMAGTEGADRLLSQESGFSLDGEGYFQVANGFSKIIVLAGGGNDFAQLADTPNNDQIVANSFRTRLANAAFELIAEGFERTNVVSRMGGVDTATIVGTGLDDRVIADAASTTVVDGLGVISRVVGFDRVDVDVRGGNDSAVLVGGTGADQFEVSQYSVLFETAMQQLGLTGIERTEFDGNGGLDEILFGDFEELDLLSAIGDRATAVLGRHSVTAIDFDFLEAQTKTGQQSNYDIDAVDYLYMLRGAWDELG